MAAYVAMFISRKRELEFWRRGDGRNKANKGRAGKKNEAAKERLEQYRE